MPWTKCVNMLLLVKHAAGQKIVLAPFHFRKPGVDLGWFQKDMKIEEYWSKSRCTKEL